MTRKEKTPAPSPTRWATGGSVVASVCGHLASQAPEEVIESLGLPPGTSITVYDAMAMKLASDAMGGSVSAFRALTEIANGNSFASDTEAAEEDARAEREREEWKRELRRGI